MKIVACSKCGAKNRVDERRLAVSEAKCGKCGTSLGPVRSAESTDTSRPLIVTDASFQRDVLHVSGTPVLMDCWAPWCGPCRAIAPLLDQLASESQGHYRIAKLNVDENPQTASRYQIASIPTMLIFKDGQLVDRIVGAAPKQSILERLTRVIGVT